MKQKFIIRHASPPMHLHRSFYRLPARAARVALLLGVALPAACATPTADAPPDHDAIAPGAIPVTTTFLSFQSDAGDYLGNGETHRYGAHDGTWAVAPLWDSNGIQGVTASIGTSNGDGYRVTLTPPQGATLALGRYELAERWPFNTNGRPGIDFGSNHRGCNALTGRFEVVEIATGDGPTLDRLHAFFEMHCDGGAPALRGELALVNNPVR